MTKSDDAREKADDARAQVKQSLISVKNRLSPHAIREDVAEAVRTRASNIAEGATEAVKSRPALIGGVAALATMLLIRKPLGKLIRRNFKETQNGEQSEG